MNFANSKQRPLLAMIDEDAPGDEARVTVVLGWDDKAFEGEATGSSDNSSRPRLVGEATLRAVELVAEGRVTLDLNSRWHDIAGRLTGCNGPGSGRHRSGRLRRLSTDS